MDNDIRFNNPDKSHDPAAGGGNVYKYPVIGIVKDNIDPNYSGSLRVQIEGSTKQDSASTDDGSWITVQRMSTFFGATIASSNSTGSGSFKTNPTSYGQWQAPPDIGTKVLCIFVNGDPTRGYYMGAIADAESLHMVPAIGASSNVVPNSAEASAYGDAARLPVTNINTNDSASTNSSDFNNQSRPVHSYSAAIMFQQGIIKDPLRGPISSSASREPVSRVGWGVSTPGRPIYQGGYDDSTLPNNLNASNNDSQLQVIGRRGGHSFVMDDGDIVGRDQLVRIRTSLGHQILMSDDGQTLSILHSNGQTYVELGKEGTVDIYSTNSINLRTQGDLNFHADRDVNIHAANSFNVHANTYQIDADKDIKLVSTGNILLGAQGKLSATTTGAMSFKSTGEASFFSSAKTFINGSKINLNSGNPSTSPESLTQNSLNMHTDTTLDNTKGFVSSPASLKSVTSRAPAHYPWVMAGKGVNVNVSLSTSSSAGSNSALSSQINTALANTNSSTVSLSTLATIPNVSGLSSSIDSTTTKGILSGISSSTSLGSTANVASLGASIVSTAGAAAGTAVNALSNVASNTIAVGTFSQTASQLVSGGILKPGSSTLINALVNNGANIQTAIPSSLFTGKNGITSITQLATNQSAQINSMQAVLQKSLTSLNSSGFSTSNVSLTSGLISAASMSTPSTIVNAINNPATLLSKTIISQISTSTAGLASLTGTSSFIGTSGLTKSLSLSNASVTGNIIQSSLNAITSSLPSLTANTSQNLLALSSGTSTSALAGGMAAFKSGGINSLISAGSVLHTSGIIDPSTLLSSGINSLTGGINSIVSIASSSLFSGVSGSGSISSAVNNLTKTASIGLSSLLGSSGIGPAATKTPVAASGTTDRSALSKQVTNLLGSSTIPSPDLLNSSSSSSSNSILPTAPSADIAALTATLNAAVANYSSGDKRIIEAKTALNAAIAASQKI